MSLVKIYISFFIVFINLNNGLILAQVKTDAELMLNHANQLSNPIKRNVVFGVTENKSAWVKYNPVLLVGGGAMFFYQKVISRQLSATCAFSPSCSEAGRGYVKEFGFFKGIFCTADRLMRCNKVSVSEYRASDFDKHDGKIHESVEYYK
jgi:putative component of membrane protein insertase Oxa1/YidC/SpoIIIJ protein YidD